jgi:L-rhamnose mutarotase
MLEALKEAGWKNYTLFLKPDGELIGYFETDDLASSQRKMQMNSINARWQREMSQYFDSLEKGPDQSIVPLAQIFHLD